MWSTAPLLCAPTAPPASLSQMDTPATAPWGLQGPTAIKVASFLSSLHLIGPSLSPYLNGFVRSVVAISDPFFSGNQSSWMSFRPLGIRRRTVLQMQFQPLSPDGILVYTAQHLGARAGEDICSSNHLQD